LEFLSLADFKQFPAFIWELFMLSSIASKHTQNHSAKLSFAIFPARHDGKAGRLEKFQQFRSTRSVVSHLCVDRCAQVECQLECFRNIQLASLFLNSTLTWVLFCFLLELDFLELVSGNRQAMMALRVAQAVAPLVGFWFSEALVVVATENFLTRLIFPIQILLMGSLQLAKLHCRFHSTGDIPSLQKKHEIVIYLENETKQQKATKTK
jgi:hypothetical protein